MNFTFLNCSRYQILAWTNNLHFMDQISPERVPLVENGNNEQHHRILQIRIRLVSILSGAIPLLGQSRGPRAKFANKNVTALLGQVGDS